jgi:hypothetical protein
MESLQMIGLRKYRRASVMRSNTVDVMVVVAQLLLQTRAASAWDAAQC